MYGMARFSWQQLRRFVYDNLHNDDYKSKVSNCINYLLIILIVGNVAAVLLESINEIYKLYKPYFDLFENISIVIFSGEYLLRFWSVIEEDREEAAWKQRIRWMKSGGAIVDLMAILPAYLNFFVHIDLRFLRVLLMWFRYTCDQFGAVVRCIYYYFRCWYCSFASRYFGLRFG